MWTMTLWRALTALLPVWILTLTGCGKPDAKAARQMGERVDVGQLSYIVVESTWRTQLGEGLNVRSPQNRFLLLTLAIKNRGTSEAAIPLLNLEASNGQTYQELSDGAGVNDWLGILRKAAPEQTIEGRILFDVPLSTYRIKLPEVGESGYDRFTWVEIPLSIDADPVQAPLPGGEVR